MPEKPEKTEKPLQQQTISLRISEALRSRLERAKEILSSKTGESVSTSEVAKQILEAARGDRFEVAELMENPTEALLQIRKKGEANTSCRGPSGYCWRTLCRGDSKPIPTGRRTRSPAKSLIAVLDAFLAVYELRTERASTRDPTTSATCLPSAVLRRQKDQRSRSTQRRRWCAGR